jgi:hypothetical protein
MRPNHSNKRMRGRHNRKPSNPLARSYESNGPDVKVRGTPQHIVEKYSQLARDAQVAGDPVLAEAYLQHAEHYFRIITAAHAALAQAQGLARPGDAEPEDEGDDEDLGGFQQPYPDLRQQQQAAQQQRIEQAFADQPQPEGGQPFIPRDRPYGERQDRPERQNFGDRQPYGDRGERGERQPYGERPPFDRGERQERGDRRFPPRGPRQDFRPRRPEPEPEAGPEGGLPSFITGGGQRPVNGEVEGQTAAPPPEATEGGEGRFPYRSRRRRRGRGFEGEGGSEAGDGPSEPTPGRAEDQPAE